MEPPPFDREFDTFENVLSYANSWAQEAGYAITTERRTNRAKDSTYRRVDLCCDCGSGTRASQATGSRLNALSRKIWCPFKIKVNLIGDLWVCSRVGVRDARRELIRVREHVWPQG